MNDHDIKPFTAEQAKILIVDDSIVTLKIEKDLMRTYGMNVTTAQSGNECIALLGTNRYDIIFMDHMMPNINGIETTQKIRKMKDPYFKDVIIIALSASITPNTCSIYMENGFNDFLEKPINGVKLNKFLLTYLPKKYIIEEKLTISKKAEFKEIIIKDIDTKKAIENCGGNVENYLTLLSVAYNDGKKKINILKYLANKKDIINYTIEIHALKTVAALIGSKKLSQLSKRHEIAGTNNDYLFILQNVDSLVKYYDELLNNIKLVLPEEHLVVKEKFINFTPHDLYALAKSAADAIDNFDLDSANKILDKLLYYDLLESQISYINKSKSFLEVFDYDSAYEEITNFKYSLRVTKNL